MLPIPLSLTERIQLLLRQISTVGSSSLVDMMGIHVFAEATTIHVPGVTLQVADACSGFSTLYASMTVAFLVAYTNPSPGRKLAVLAVAAPTAVVANILRVTIFVLLALWQGAGILDVYCSVSMD